MKRCQTYSYPGGTMLVQDKPFQSFSVTVSFCYWQSQWYFQNVHLLEHLLLDNDRQLGAWIPTLADARQTSYGFNARVTTHYIQVFFESHKMDTQIVEIMPMICDTPLNISQEEIDSEWEMIQREKKHAEALDPYFETWFELFTPFRSANKMSTESIAKTHDEIIRHNHACIVLQWDMKDPALQNIQKKLSEWLCSRKIENTTHQNFPLQYNAVQDNFYNSGEQRLIDITLPVLWFAHRPIQLGILLWFHVYDVLFDFFRNKEKSEYDIRFREVFYDHDQLFHFRVKTELSSDTIIELLWNCYHSLTEEDFTLLQQKVFKIIACKYDSFDDNNYLLDTWYMTWHAIDVVELANSINHWKYEEYRIELFQCLESLSLTINKTKQE